MPIHERAVHQTLDWQIIASLLDALPASSRHLIDLPYRLCSPAMQTGTDARLWTTLDGPTAVGFAAWMPYWATLDFLVSPGDTQAAVEQAIFAWAWPRLREMDRERGRPLPYWAEAREDDMEREALLSAHGFTLVDDYQYVQCHHSLGKAVPTASPPAGITLRQLLGEHGVAACAALHRTAFASESMTEEW